MQEGTRSKLRATLVVLALALVAGCAIQRPASETDGDVRLDASVVDEPVVLSDGWRLRRGDDLAWARPDFEDSDWQPVTPWNKPATSDRWTDGGRVWLRLHVLSSPELYGHQLAMELAYLGALEVYVDGQRLHRVGQLELVRSGGETPVRWAPAGVHRFQLAERPGDEHVIAVRFEPNRVRWVRGLGWPDGFRMNVGGAELLARKQRFRDRGSSLIFAGATGAAIALSLLHLLLYAYHRSKRQNLFFAAMAAFAAVSLIATQWLQTGPTTRTAIYWAIAWNAAVMGQALVAPLFGYHAFGRRRPRVYWGVVGVAIAIGSGLLTGALPYLATFAVAWLGVLELLRTTVGALRQRLTESWVMAIGIACYVGCALWASASNSSNYQDGPVYVFALGILALLAFSSLYLGREIGRDKRALQAQLRDIEQLTEEKLEQQRKQAAIVHAEKMGAMARLVAGVAHEMNTPLGAVRSNNETAGKSLRRIRQTLDDVAPTWGDDRKLARRFDVLVESTRLIDAASDRLADIVARLRRFARLDEADIQRRELHEVVDDAIAQLSSQLDDRIHLDVQLGDTPAVDCRPRDINQVVYNLLLNAAQAIDGEGAIVISTGCAEGDNVWLSVQDDGHGIADEDRDRIFDPGFTTRGVGVGTGLGLSICQRIVEDHGGTIQLESAPGGGTTVTVTLPTRAGEQPR
jgi:signal transduction histidine kinase